MQRSLSHDVRHPVHSQRSYESPFSVPTLHNGAREAASSHSPNGASRGYFLPGGVVPMDHDMLSDSSSSPKSDDSVKTPPTPDPCTPEVMKVLSGMCEDTFNPPALTRQRHKSSPALHARPPLDHPPTIRDSSTNAEPPPDWQNVTPKLEPDPTRTSLTQPRARSLERIATVVATRRCSCSE